MYCPNCGTSNQDGAKFCENCGKAMPVGDSAAVPSSETPSSESSAPPPVIIKQKNNWINTLLLGLLLLAVICVGSLFYVTYVSDTVTSVQEMIADPDILVQEFSKIGEQIVQQFIDNQERNGEGTVGGGGGGAVEATASCDDISLEGVALSQETLDLLAQGIAPEEIIYSGLPDGYTDDFIFFNGMLVYNQWPIDGEYYDETVGGDCTVRGGTEIVCPSPKELIEAHPVLGAEHVQSSMIAIHDNTQVCEFRQDFLFNEEKPDAQVNGCEGFERVRPIWNNDLMAYELEFGGIQPADETLRSAEIYFEISEDYQGNDPDPQHLACNFDEQTGSVLCPNPDDIDYWENSQMSTAHFEGENCQWVGLWKIRDGVIVVNGADNAQEGSPNVCAEAFAEAPEFHLYWYDTSVMGANVDLRPQTWPGFESQQEIDSLRSQELHDYLFGAENAVEDQTIPGLQLVLNDSRTFGCDIRDDFDNQGWLMRLECKVSASYDNLPNPSSFSLFGFGCEGPLASVQQISVPSVPGQSDENPPEFGECGDGYHMNNKGKCVEDQQEIENACSPGYVPSGGTCCPTSFPNYNPSTGFCEP